MSFDKKSNRVPQTFITTLSRQVVSDIANDELIYFDTLIQAYFQPDALQPTDHETDHVLGSGVYDTVVFLTPFVAMGLQLIVPKFLETLAEKSGEHLFDKYFGKKAETIDLSASQIARIKTETIRELTKQGLTQTDADKITNAIIVQLVSQPPATTSDLQPGQGGEVDYEANS